MALSFNVSLLDSSESTGLWRIRWTPNNPLDSGGSTGLWRIHRAHRDVRRNPRQIAILSGSSSWLARRRNLRGVTAPSCNQPDVQVSVCHDRLPDSRRHALLLTSSHS